MRIVDPQTDPVNIIEAIRSKNNGLWMNILRIALKHAPAETQKILREVRTNDLMVSEFIAELINEDIEA